MKRKIGIFDSGIGGLNVLNDLISNFPEEDYIYLADTKNCPYGLKTSDEVRNITENNIRYFERINVKAIIIACNTATANSYEINSPIPIIRIIEPAANNAKIAGGRIGVLATNLTVDTLAYQRFLPDAIGIRASELVGIAEDGLFNTDISYNVLLRLLEPVKGRIDTLILGCTHFSNYREQIKMILEDIKIVDSSLAISPILKEQINIEKGNGTVELLTTGDENEVNTSWLVRKDVKIKHIDI